MAMIQNVYKELLEVMKNRGGPYAGLDIPEFYALVEALFTPEEAEMNNVLARKPAAAEDIAGRINRDKNEVTAILERMADKGLCAIFKGPGVPLYQGIAFMPGIFEFQFISGGETERDKRIAELIHAYKKAHESAKGVAKISFPATRVIPVARTIKAGNVIHTYHQVSGFQPVFDSERCISCETCIERCPPQALAMDENNAQIVNTDRCFGCGICAT